MSTTSAVVRVIESFPSTYSNDIAFITKDADGDLWFGIWDGATNQVYSSGDRAFAWTLDTTTVETPTNDKLIRHGEWFESNGQRNPFTF